MPGRITIISDGTPHGTKVYCDDVPIKNVMSVSWSMADYKSFGRVVITVEEVSVNVQGETVCTEKPYAVEAEEHALHEP